MSDFPAQITHPISSLYPAPSFPYPTLSSLLHDYAEDQGLEGWSSGRREPYAPLDPIQEMPVCL